MRRVRSHKNCVAERPLAEIDITTPEITKNISTPDRQAIAISRGIKPAPVDAIWAEWLNTTISAAKNRSACKDQITLVGPRSPSARLGGQHGKQPSRVVTRYRNHSRIARCRP